MTDDKGKPMRSLLFDMDGVMLDGWHTDPAKRRRWDANLQEDLGIDKDAFQTFFPTVFIPKVLCGHMNLHEALAEFLPKIGSDVAPQTLIDYWLPRDVTINKAAWAMVEKIKATGKVNLYVATNQEHIRARYLWEKAGFNKLFQKMFYAADLKAPKPELAFYKGCEAQMPPSKQPPLFFDDYDLYVDGARKAGWEAHVYEDERTCLDHPFIKDLLAA